MYSSLMLQSSAQRWIVALMYSGPLLQLMTPGLPRQAMSWRRARITGSAGKEKSILQALARSLCSLACDVVYAQKGSGASAGIGH